MMDLRTIARALGGVVSGRQVSAPGPGHSSRDRSLTVRLSPAAPHGILVHSHAGDHWQACRDYVLGRLGISPMLSPRQPSPVDRMALRAARAKQRREEKADNEQRARSALRIWEEAMPISGTPADAYLRSRNLDPVAAALRFHPQCPFAGQRVPAMVGLVTDVRTGKPRAVHRTALTLNGQKAEVVGHSRLSLGPLRGGAIRLHDEPSCDVLGVGEGIESALSLHRVPEFARASVWSLLAASGLKALPVIRGVASLWIAVDHDPAGIDAAKACAVRWRKAGCTVRLIVPDQPRTDLNDLIRSQGVAA